jgi:hypothetical protein
MQAFCQGEECSLFQVVDPHLDSGRSGSQRRGYCGLLRTLPVELLRIAR